MQAAWVEAQLSAYPLCGGEAILRDLHDPMWVESSHGWGTMYRLHSDGPVDPTEAPSGYDIAAPVQISMLCGGLGG